MDDGVHLPDIAQELVAQALPLGGPLHQAGDVHEFYHRWGDLLRLVHVPQELQPLVRHGYDSDIGVDGTEGVIGGFRARFGQ